MSEETIMDHIHTAIKKGRRAEALWEMFLETIEYEIGQGGTKALQEIMVKFKQNQDEYHDSMEKLRTETQFMLEMKDKTHQNQ